MITYEIRYRDRNGQGWTTTEKAFNVRQAINLALDRDDVHQVVRAIPIAIANRL